MTYAGLGTFLLRLLGLLSIVFAVVALVPVVAYGPATQSQAAFGGGFLILPGVILIVASKPLGRILAAGIE